MTSEAEAQEHARWQVKQIVRALRSCGWDFVAVSLWRNVVADYVHGAGASMFEVTKALTPSLPRLADNLRVLARELDAAHRSSGAPEVTDGYTHVVGGTTVDARRKGKPCRACSECEGEHHWLEYVGYVCKHCEVAAPDHVVDALLEKSDLGAV